MEEVLPADVSIAGVDLSSLLAYLLHLVSVGVGELVSEVIP